MEEEDRNWAFPPRSCRPGDGRGRWLKGCAGRDARGCERGGLRGDRIVEGGPPGPARRREGWRGGGVRSACLRGRMLVD